MLNTYLNHGIYGERPLSPRLEGISQLRPLHEGYHDHLLYHN